MAPDRPTRRQFVRATGTTAAVGVAGALAGCSDGGDGGDGGGGGPTSVAAGPNGDLVFEPEEVTVSVGDAVQWTFESPGHNVSANPEHNDQVSIPEGAEPFFSGESGDPFSTMEQGSTFEHTFRTAGEWTYVCVPHASAGMVGTVVVEE